MFPRKITGNAFTFISPHEKNLSNINHHSVSFLHKNAVDLTKKMVCAFNAKIISTFVNAKSIMTYVLVGLAVLKFGTHPTALTLTDMKESLGKY